MANPYEPPAAPAFSGWNRPPTAASADSYEFTDIENAIIDKAGRRARLWGIFSFIIGGFSALAALFFLLAGSKLLAQMNRGSFGSMFSAILGGAAVLLVITAIVYVVMGKLYVDAGASLRAAVTTTGSDIEHVTESLRKLGTAFQVESIMTVLALVVGLVAGAVGVATQLGGT